MFSIAVFESESEPEPEVDADPVLSAAVLSAAVLSAAALSAAALSAAALSAAVLSAVGLIYQPLPSLLLNLAPVLVLLSSQSLLPSLSSPFQFSFLSYLVTRHKVPARPALFSIRFSFVSCLMSQSSCPPSSLYFLLFSKYFLLILLCPLLPLVLLASPYSNPLSWPSIP